mmetsp:Transcript_75421/g.125742  ORF Transcript_75421/g.125742 Transcript_75421/m.125742 type:complete len:357 (-) Transcript_75421:348-1418(-)|eukprot:CAMPEP_0119311646 /NCGR_PEP_ID=MMETSP1333-20130426/23200_1 /TAXON_ID=418940 /ORGANISM="Scyphosphaera apsteinii, Strain RCC1455" /LENGTH=356 /DNA_ID=CAMNT_0007316075 /DNA_START=279 /DNA_END=1349 /DNA_ORIENTATION=+
MWLRQSSKRRSNLDDGPDDDLADSVEITVQTAVGTKIGIDVEERKDGTNVILDIVPGSAADRSGLLSKGDIIHSINGECAKGRHIEELVKSGATTYRIRIITSSEAEATESAEARDEMIMLKNLAETRRRSVTILHANGASLQSKVTAASGSSSDLAKVPAADASPARRPSLIKRVASSRSAHASSAAVAAATSPRRESSTKTKTVNSFFVAAAATATAASSRKLSIIQKMTPKGSPSACAEVPSPAALPWSHSVMQSMDDGHSSSVPAAPAPATISSRNPSVKERAATWGSCCNSAGVALSPRRPSVRKRAAPRRSVLSFVGMPTVASAHVKSTVMDKVATWGSFPAVVSADEPG